MKGKMQKVVECKSRLNLTGSEVWDLTLACGARQTITKQGRNKRIAKPAPSRVKCLCDKCAVVEEKV